MADATSEFFDQLAQRGPVPALERTSGTLRVDLERDGGIQHWHVQMHRGSIAVSRIRRRTPTASFGPPGACSTSSPAGRANALAAALRGELAIEGDPALLVRFQRLFPPPTGRKPHSARTVGKRRG